MRPPLSQPVMIYDGDCKFCRKWIRRWATLTEDRVIYLPYQGNLQAFPQLTEEMCKKAVQFVETDGKVYGAAEGVLRSLNYSNNYKWMYRFYKNSKLFASFAEWIYSIVAKNRNFFK